MKKSRLDIKDDPVALRLAEGCLYQRIQAELDLYPGKISKEVIRYSERVLIRPVEAMEMTSAIATEVFETRIDEIIRLIMGETVSVRQFSDRHHEIEMLLKLHKPGSIAESLIEDSSVMDLNVLGIAGCIQRLGRIVLKDAMDKSLEIVRAKFKEAP